MNPAKSRGATVVVIGCGEIGRPIARLCSTVHEDVICIDKDTVVDYDTIGMSSVMHVCLPGNMPNFVGIVKNYVVRINPELVIVHSTTAPGTMNELADFVGVDYIVHSQVHGKHRCGKMLADMLRHQKFIAADSDIAVGAAINHLKEIGFAEEKLVILPKLISGELVKIFATSLFALLIAYAQEIKRIGVQHGIEYEVLSLFKNLETSDFDFSTITPGVIGGHCLMQNIGLLNKTHKTLFAEFIKKSNDLYKKEIK